MNKVKLTRGQIGRFTQGLDITVKSASGWARDFVPTWDMVMGHKAGRISDAQYTEEYTRILSQSHAAVQELRALGLKQEGQVRLLCFCRDGAFCHTHLLIDWLVANYPDAFEDGRLK